MTGVQAHRGPDDSGLWDKRFPDGSYIGLGSRRLAIIDLSRNGRMPMCNQDRTLWITYNGEVYNFKFLRQHLESKGHKFTTGTDTEVILRLYEEYGSDCVERLRGMFAFAICDLRSGTPTLFFARDHFGIKPLYYAQRGARFAFASEVKAILEVPGFVPEMDLDSLHQYLTFLWVPDPKTMFRGVFKLPAGHYAILRDDRLSLTKYWDLTFPDAGVVYPLSEDELSGEIRERFQRCVENQMVGDVPIGAFLSAGLDSSSIVAILARAARHPVRTYTITFPKKHLKGENAIDDPSVPARFARQLGCDHQQIVVEPDVVDLLPRLVWHMDEPTADPAIVAAYLVCRAARKHSTVLLSGVGGDELFGGYRKYSAFLWAHAYQRIPAALRAGLESALLCLPRFRGTSWKGSVRLAKKMARSASLSPVDQFIRNCTYLDRQNKQSVYTSELLHELSNNDPTVEHRRVFKDVEHADFLNQMLYADTKIFMTSLNLTYNDKMSMASSAEVRVPFLDADLAEFIAWNVPPHWKLKGGLRPTTKYIFRKAMGDLLPPEVLRQPKAGFAAPVDYWLANDARPMVDDLLSESRIRERGLLRPEVVSGFVDEHRSGREDWSMQIWQFLTLELWMQTFIDGKRSDGCGELGQAEQAAIA